jgi:hypothetical protein
MALVRHNPKPRPDFARYRPPQIVNRKVSFKFFPQNETQNGNARNGRVSRPVGPERIESVSGSKILDRIHVSASRSQI